MFPRKPVLRRHDVGSELLLVLTTIKVEDGIGQGEDNCGWNALAAIAGYHRLGMAAYSGADQRLVKTVRDLYVATLAS